MVELRSSSKMGALGSPARMLAALVLVVFLFSSCTVTAFDGYNGMPRPRGMGDKPSTSLGAKPAVKYLGKPADCSWYAWENLQYPLEQTSNCSSLLWSSLSQDADPAKLEGFTYYAPIGQPEFYDPAFDEYLCLIGCFNLAATGSPSPAPKASPAPAKPPVNAPPPSMPPPMTPPPMTPPPSTPPPMTPPPSTPPPTMPPPSTPPPTMPPAIAPVVPPPSSPKMAPAPATLFRPPPPGLPLAPASIVTPGAQAPGAGTQAPGPSTQTSAASSTLIRISGSSLSVFVAAIFLWFG